MQLAKRLDYYSADMASILNKMCKAGILEREKGWGIQGGYGYRLSENYASNNKETAQVHGSSQAWNEA